MRLTLVGNLPKHIEKTEAILGITLGTGGELVQVIQNKEMAESLIVKAGEIIYKENHHFFRALSLYVQERKESESFERKETGIFSVVGAMIDASRNAVYHVPQVKDLLVHMALMGHNTCMLYTEDTYEVKEYPYFGYLRGRYSTEELKEIDAFADELGIEVIPCIQTLAHLKATLRWDYARDMKDTEDILLVGEEKAYQFIETMIKTCSDIFKSRRVHIGMDEAMDLGRGRFIAKNGYRSQHDIIGDHLVQVCDIIRKYDLEPMMWDDMFYRACSPHSGYQELGIELNSEMVSRIPKELTLVYWDYYHADKNFYDKFFEKRHVFNNKTLFAGGVWKWMGFAPGYTRTFATTNAALSQCKKHGIDEVIATAWGDDGCDAPLRTIYMGLILFAEHAYYEEVDEEWLDKRTKTLTGLGKEDFMLLEELDLLPWVKRPNLQSYNPSKYFLYQDILLGAFDLEVRDVDVVDTHYKVLASKYLEVASRAGNYSDMYNMFATLSDVLSIKATLGVKLRKAYKEQDKEALQELTLKVLPALEGKVLAFHEALACTWQKEAKGHGLEVQDLRIGGLLGRIHTVKAKLERYLKGEIGEVEELEEAILPFCQLREEGDEMARSNYYSKIASQNNIHK